MNSSFFFLCLGHARNTLFAADWQSLEQPRFELFFVPSVCRDKAQPCSQHADLESCQHPIVRVKEAPLSFMNALLRLPESLCGAYHGVSGIVDEDVDPAKYTGGKLDG